MMVQSGKGKKEGGKETSNTHGFTKGLKKAVLRKRARKLEAGRMPVSHSVGISQHAICSGPRVPWRPISGAFNALFL